MDRLARRSRSKEGTPARCDDEEFLEVDCRKEGGKDEIAAYVMVVVVITYVYSPCSCSFAVDINVVSGLVCRGKHGEWGEDKCDVSKG